MTVSAKKSGTDNGCLLSIGVIGIIALLVSIGKCSETGGVNSAAVTADNAMAETLTNAVAAQSPPPVEPLNVSSVKRGAGHLHIAIKAEGLPGAMIYSQNCYDALSHSFSWSKLDVCAAFDMKAVASLPEDDQPGLEKEAAYFQSETTAGRFLAAATGAGESSEDADTRLSDIQARLSKTPAVVATANAGPFDSETMDTASSNEDSGSR